MPSAYPGALDTLPNPTGSDMQDTADHAGLHADLNDGIEAVQATLGLNPQGAAATLAARLEYIETRLTEAPL